MDICCFLNNIVMGPNAPWPVVRINKNAKGKDGGAKAKLLRCEEVVLRFITFGTPSHFNSPFTVPHLRTFAFMKDLLLAINLNGVGLLVLLVSLVVPNDDR